MSEPILNVDTYQLAVVKNSTIPNELSAVDWLHVPSKQEFLQLLNGNFICPTPDEIEGCFGWSLSGIRSKLNTSNNNNNNTWIEDRQLRQRVEETKKVVSSEVQLQAWHYEFPAHQYEEETLRSEETIIRECIVECNKKMYEKTQPKMWLQLTAKLSESGWVNLWENMNLTQLMQCNWLLYLIKKREQEKKDDEAKRYAEANLLAKVIGWY